MSSSDHALVAKLEVEFRHQWRGFDPGRIQAYLERVDPRLRGRLLGRLLCAEVEFVYQPPVAAGSDLAEVTPHALSPASAPLGFRVEEDDERIRPTVELLLLRFPELRKNPDSLITLCVLEFACRLRHDTDSPTPETYLPLLAGDEVAQQRLHHLLALTDRRLTSQATEDSVIEVAAGDSTVKDAEVQASIASLPLPATLNCFLLLRQLGRGGMGYVYAAVDLRSAAQVAVKVMRRNDAWSVFRFTEEFFWLSRLNHPNLVRLYDAFQDGRHYYFSMELVEGRLIRRWFDRVQQKHPQHAWKYLRGALAQIASAIHYLHHHRVLHCDVKCSNVMIDQRGRAKLLDLGLASREGTSQPLMGTLQYLAPEIVNGEPPTRASDWYSFGMMMYELITGDHLVAPSASANEKPLFSTASELQDRLSSSACPTDLAELCLALLENAPQARPTGHTILQRLGNPPTAITPMEPLVGRDDLLHTLRDFLLRSPSAPTAWVLLQGDAGSGKTSLLQHWFPTIDTTEWLPVMVGCSRHDHSPHRLLNGLLLELSEAVRLDERLRQSLQGCLGKCEAVPLVFPAMGRMITEESSSSLASGSGSYPATSWSSVEQELIECLIQLAQIRPLLFIIDDAHQGDERSLRFLQKLTRQQAFRGLVVLTVDSARADAFQQTLARAERSVSAPEAASDPFHLVEVPPLPPSVALQLARQVGQRTGKSLSESMIEFVAAQSLGNPFLIKELVRARVAEMERRQLERPTLGGSRSRSTEEVEFLPLPAETILQYLSIAEQPLTFQQLQMVSRIPPSELQDALESLARQGWLRATDEAWDQGVYLSHDAFRIPILQRMPESRQQRRHYRLARMLSCQFPPPWVSMAKHYFAAQSFREAAACFLEAGRQHYAAGDYASALEFFTRADHPAAVRDAEQRKQLQVLRAACAAGAGQAGLAAKLYDRLAQQADDPGEQAEFWALAGEQWIRSGELERGLSRLQSCSQVPKFADRTRRGNQWHATSLRIRVLWQALRHWRGWKLAPHPSREFTTSQRCLARIPLPTTFLDSRLGPEILLQQLRLIQSTGTDADRGLLLINAGLLLSLAGRRWRPLAVQWLRQGAKLVRSTEPGDTRCQYDLTRAVWSILAGRWSSAERGAARAIQGLSRPGGNVQWERRFAQWLRIAALWYGGDIKRMRQVTEHLRHETSAHADRISQLFGNVGPIYWGDLFVGDAERIDAALDEAVVAIADPSFQSPRFFWWLSHIFRSLYRQDVAAAWETLESQWPAVHREYLYLSPHYQWLSLWARLSTELNLWEWKAGGRRRASAPQRTIRRLRRSSATTYTTYADAFELAVDGWKGMSINSDRIEFVAGRLMRHQHMLMVHAVRLNAVVATDWTPAVKDLYRQSLCWFHEQGCADIVATMRFLLPLPRRVLERVQQDYQQLQAS
ncbi:MAG: hypothetical protein KatS3mg111_4035 [Pirellulaceae bacterium]|nr:MAG: hypothetical protein KatS3mg111_4035 [Pirellulaceae bacterium]